MARGHQPQRCSFCGKGRDQTQRLIAGPNGVFICAECVALCDQILAEGPQPPATPTNATRGATPHPQRPAWRRILFHG